jgi:hypothetical protein
MSEYGFIDNFDKRYLSGWRYILYLSGACELKFVRKMLKGRWEAWWIEPCLSYVWHPVSQKSSFEENIRPCPSWGPLFYSEEY